MPNSIINTGVEKVSSVAIKMRIRARKGRGKVWAIAHRLPPPSRRPEIVFGMALIGKSRARDWMAVQQNLLATLRTLERQTDDGWRLYICCHDRPELVDFNERVRYVPFKGDFPSKADQFRKRSAIIDVLSRESRGDGYLFLLDADDLLHPDLVEFIVHDNNGNGYIVRDGYLMNVASRRIGLLGNRVGSLQFYQQCGSCAAFRFDFRGDLGFAGALKRMNYWHSHYPDLARWHGFELASIPFPSVIYVMNHGENAQLRLGHLSEKDRLIDAYPLSPEEAEEVRRTFGLALA